MVIVWRLSGYLLFYIGDVLPLQWAKLTETFIQPGWALSLSMCFFGLHDVLYVLFLVILLLISSFFMVLF